MGWVGCAVDVFSSVVGIFQVDRLPPCLERRGGLPGALSLELFPFSAVTSISSASWPEGSRQEGTVSRVNKHTRNQEGTGKAGRQPALDPPSP